jgi:hypothetical protein
MLFLLHTTSTYIPLLVPTPTSGVICANVCILLVFCSASNFVLLPITAYYHLYIETSSYGMPHFAAAVAAWL